MEFIRIVIILFNILFFINADVNGPNYPTNYVAPISGQLNLPVSQQTVGVNTLNNGILTSQNINQLLYGANGGSVVAGLNGLSGLTGANNLGTNGIITGMNGLTNIQTSEIIRQQIQTSNFNALNGGATGIVNPIGTTTVIGANGIPISTNINSLNGLTAVNAVIDPTTGATVGYVGANGIVTPINNINNNPAGLNSNEYQVVAGLNGVNTVVDRVTGVTVGYVGANGVVTPVGTGINSLQTGYSGINPATINNNGYQVVTGMNGVNTVIDRVTGITVGYVGANGVVTPITNGVNGIQTGYANLIPGVNNGYQVVAGLNGVNTVVDRVTGLTVGYVGANGVVIPVGTGTNSLQTGYSGINPATINNNGYQVIIGQGGVNTVVDKVTGVTVGYLGANGIVTPVGTGIDGIQTGYANLIPGVNNGYQVVNSLNGVNTIPPSNGYFNTGLNQYNTYQTGYGSLYPPTMGGTGMNGYPYNTGLGMNGMNQYYGQQLGYNGYPYTGQYSGYPTNGNSNSQASSSSKTF